jgi:hypothetical protein
MEVSSQFHPPGKYPPVSIGDVAAWAPEPVWMLWSIENLLPLLGIELRPVAH